MLVGTSLVGRGDFSISDMRSYVDYIQKKGHFTPWSSTAMKIGLCNVPPINHDRSMMGLFNTSAISAVFDEMLQQFTKLYNKKVNNIQVKYIYETR